MQARATSSRAVSAVGSSGRTVLYSTPLSRPRVAVRSGAANLSNGESNGTGFAAGQKVKVVKQVKVFHVPKLSELQLEGMTGEVLKNCTDFKGKVLSANLPYVVKFSTQVGEKNVSFQAHLGDDELEAL